MTAARPDGGTRGEAPPAAPQNGGLRVAVVLPSLQLGGAERLVVETFRLAHRERHPERYTLVVLTDERCEVSPEELRALGVDVVILGVAGRLDPRAVLALRRAFRAARPAVVHSHLPRTSVLVRLALLGTGIPHLYTEHNVPEAYAPATRLLNRWTLFLNDVTVAVSDEVAAVARATAPAGAAGRRLVVIRNGVDVTEVARAAAAGDVRRELGIAPDALVLGLVAHFRPQKAHDLLIRAVAQLGRSDVVVVLAGRDDGTEPAARSLAAELGLAGRVHFLGFRRDAAAVLRALDLLVMPSLQEGLPIALLEAMVLGVPATASRVGGIPQVVTDGVNGVLVPVGDVPALAAAVGGLLSDPARRAALAERARETVEERFSIGRMIRGYRAEYARLATRGS